MNYMIRFEGHGSTLVRVRSTQDALQIGQMFERRGKTNISIQAGDGEDMPLAEFRKLHPAGSAEGSC